jgi:DNA-binding beta-propeller fold protein YncE
MNFSSGILTQIAGQVGISGYFGDGDFAANAIFYNPLRPLALLNGDVIVADSRNNRVRYVNTTSGIITAFSGIKGEFHYDISNEGKPALEGFLFFPSGVAEDSRGDYFIADNWNSKIRRVSNGRIFLFAGHATISPEGRNDRNYPGIVDDGRPANNTLLFNPSTVLLDDADNVIIANAGHHTIRLVNRTTGLIYTLAGRHAVSGNEGNGGLAVSAFLNNPQGLALQRSTGNIFIADTVNNAIRMILGATGIIMLVGGDATGSKGYFDSANNLFSRFDYPYDIAVSPEGALFVADNNNNAVRHLPFSTPTTCPAGFFCSCGLNLAPCTSASSFCPVNSKVPVTVSPGFFAVSTTPLAAAGDATIMYTSQRMCPVGFYCAAGVAIPCRAGTYGVALLQSVAASCFKCAPGTYLAESGLALLNSSSPCIPCPPGSGAGAAGGRFCPFCEPGFFSNASSCTSCPAGTSSGYGASRCFPPSANDRAAASRDAFTYSRILPVNSGNKDSTTVLLAGMAPFLLLIALSCIVLSLSRARCAPLWAVTLLERVDMFNIEGPRERGDSPKNHPTRMGGFWTVFGVSIVVYLAFSSLVQFLTSNIQLQRSELTVNALSLSSFGDLPPIVTALSSPPPLMTVVAGFRIEVATMGRQCHNVSASTDSLRGSLTYTLLPAENGAYTHRFDCTGCVASALTFFLAVFPPTCQSFLVRLSAIDGGGSATVSEFVASNAGLRGALLSSVTATVPLQIEILQDLYAGAPRASDGLVVAGRSAIGYKVAAPQSILLATDGNVDDRAGAVALRLNLPLQNSYTVYTFVPLMTTLTLVSTMAAWLGVFPFFGFAKDLTSGIGKASSTVGRVWGQRAVVKEKPADGAAWKGAPSAPQQPSVALGGASGGATRNGIDGGGAALQYERGQRESLPAGHEVWGGAPAAAVAETQPRSPGGGGSPGEVAAVTPSPAPSLSTGFVAALGYIFACVCKYVMPTLHPLSRICTCPSPCRHAQPPTPAFHRAKARSAAVRPTTAPSP